MNRITPLVTAILVMLSAHAAHGAREPGAEFRLAETLVSSVSPAGDTDPWYFNGVAGSKVAFAAAAYGSSLLPTLDLLAPDGQSVGTVSAKGAKATLSAVLPATGRYRLVVGGSGGTAGMYLVRTKGKAPSSLKLPGATLSPGETVDFEVCGDDLSVISVKYSGPKDVTFRTVAVLDPAGREVFGALDAFGPNRDARAGTFTVYSGFGLYRIRLGDASAPATVACAAKVKSPKPLKAVKNLAEAEPRPTGVNPAVGAPAAWVAVTGSGFLDGCTVWFGDVQATAVSRVSESRIEARVPAAAPREVALDVAVRSADGVENSLASAFTVLTPPSLNTVTPTRVAPGETVLLTGSDFEEGAAVLFGSTAASSVEFLASTSLRATVPAGLPEGTYNVTVRNPDLLTSTLTSALAVEAAPALTGVDPVEGERGDPVRVYGTGFVPGTAVLFAGVASPVTSFVSDGELTAVIPSGGLTDGDLDITVRKPLGTEDTLPDALLLHPSPAGPGLVITGIIDGPRTGGYPKAVELRATADVASLSAFTIRLASNGSTWSASTLTLSGSATKGQFLYASYESAGFTAYFGSAPDFVSTTTMNFNGNDAIGLFLSGELVDVYGDYTEVSSSSDFGDAWAYQDGYAVRKTGLGPRASFDPTDWTFSGLDALDAQGSSGTNGSAGITVPFGTWFWR